MLINTLVGVVVGAISFAQGATVPSQRTDDNIVDLGYVKYLGNRTWPNTNAFLGIPYAEPPLGERRFRTPAPLDTQRVASESKGKVVDVTEYDNFCIQGSADGELDGAGTEDCLKLNVWAPAGAKKGDNLPVLVYIHGGGYIYGHRNQWRFDHWIRQSPNVVIVSLDYRLGVFGFLATPSFNNPLLGDFNAGFRDQIQALKWVKEYITFFGGDPNRVTINGESAGGSSVQLHLVAHEGEQLFHGAIAQSVWRGPLASPEQVEPLFEYIASSVDCNEGPTEAKLACMREANAQKLSAAHDNIPNAFNGSYTRMIPILDGKLITEYPTHAFLSGRFSQVPLIVGATTNDSVAPGSAAEALKRDWPLLTDKDIAEILALYPASNYPNEEYRANAITGDSQFFCSRSLMGSAFSDKSKAWTYRYNQRNPTDRYTTDSEPGRVGHAAENWMMFGGVNTLPKGELQLTGLNPVETAFSEELIAYWLSFVRSGDPNTYKLARSPTWTPFTKANRARIVLQQDPLNTTTQSGVSFETESNEETNNCNVILSKADHFQN